VGGAPSAGTAPEGAVELAAIESPPLDAVVAELLQESDNNTGELLLKEVGLVGGDPSTAGGAAAVGERFGTATTDGSGLSLDDRVTCSLLVELIQRPDTGDLLRQHLPTAGRTGTLDRRFVGTPLEGTLRAKTGSLTSVSSLAGQVSDDDPPILFALVVNTPDGEPVPAGVAAAQLRLGEILLSWPRVPDVDQLGPVRSGG
jgi:D-alanyl-D-alanine carboxypeptidase/D-alanyl-D-alanine-endopeptidase (penicillin-binding protein 4)